MALTDNLISFWSLEEGSGTRNDSHGTNHMADNNTVTQAVGKVGNAAQFTAANSEFLSIADNASLSTGDISYTVAAWVYIDSFTADIMSIFTKENDGPSTEQDYILRYNQPGTNRFQFVTGGTGGFNVISADNFGAASTATWYFVVGWHNTDDDTIGIQVNNGTPNTAGRSFVPTDGVAGARIGGRNAGGPRLWNGRIDQVMFAKRVWTADERTWLYNSDNGRSYAEVVAGMSGGGQAPRTMQQMRMRRQA